MTAYIIRRILWGLLLLVLVVAVTFLVFYLLPAANPAILRAGRNANPQIIATITKELGLDRPIYTQFWIYVKNIVLHLNFGFSYYYNVPVGSLLLNRLPATISLTVGAAVLWIVIGIPIGIVSAIKRRTWLDRMAMGTALVFVSAPVFWLGLIALLLAAQTIGVFHVFPGIGSYVGLTVNPLKWLESLLLPWMVLSATQCAIYARLVRGSLLQVMGEDYIRTARAKGLTERRVVLKHGMRSAVGPLVTVLGLDIAALLGGAILTESVFDIPGIGRLQLDAIGHSDIPIIQGTVLVASIFIIIANILVDIAYAYLDPRVRFE
ncbi:MAG TPA: ABC transporter permease [Solirubrobacteraceae bacterium]|jgi:peptide/nickel transport system permease protein